HTPCPCPRASPLDVVYPVGGDTGHRGVDAVACRGGILVVPVGHDGIVGRDVGQATVHQVPSRSYEPHRAVGCYLSCAVCLVVQAVGEGQADGVDAVPAL